MKKIWTDEEDAILESTFPDCSTKDLAVLLGRSYRAVSSRAYLKGVAKSDAFKKEYYGKIIENLLKDGKGSRFKKGQVAINKGKKMSPELYEKVKATMFKPGNKPHNTKEDVGHISLRKSKKGFCYKYIKLADGNWTPLHRKLWIDANGPIAPDKVVAFIDSNTENCVLENLMLISRKDNRYRNAGYITLKDSYVAGLMARNGRKVIPELAAELVKIPELIELKRNNLKLNKHVKEQRRNRGANN
jgi:hypothetical protein